MFLSKYATRCAPKATTQTRQYSAMTQYFPESPTLNRHSQPIEPLQTVSHLDNGVTLVTHETAYSPISQVTVYVNAGSRHETTESLGCSHFFQKMAFEATTFNSSIRIVRELEKTGASVSVQNGREFIAYQAQCLRQAMPKVLGVFANALRFPRLHKIDVDPHKAEIMTEAENFASNPQLLVTEGLNTSAFRGSSLANSIVCPPHAAGQMNGGKLANYHKEQFTPANLTFVGVNVDHKALTDVVNPLFGDMPTRSNADNSTAQYRGGSVIMNEFRKNNPDENFGNHVAIGYRGLGYNDEMHLDFAVLHELIGSGSNVYTHSTSGRASDLNKWTKGHSNVYSAQGFNMNYSDAGVFGIYLTMNGDSSASTVESTFEFLNNLDITKEAFEAAKKRLTIKTYSAATSRVSLSDNIARDNNYSPDAVVKAINAVSMENVQASLKAALSSTPTISAYGNVSDLTKF